MLNLKTKYKIIILFTCIIVLLFSIFLVMQKYRINITRKVISNENSNENVAINLDKIFVVNLARSTERLEKSSKQLEKINLQFERYQAVDGYELIIQGPNNNEFKGNEIKKNKEIFEENKLYKVNCPSFPIYYNGYKRQTFNFFTAGELGCYCSHLEIFKYISDNNINNALILEDDFIIDQNFKTKLANVINNLPKKWDIIFLYYDKDVKKNIMDTNNPSLKKLLPDNFNIYGTVAYVINKNSANKIFLNSLGVQMPIDKRLSWLINNSELEAYITTEPIIKTSDDDSEIHEMGRAN